MTKTPRRLLLSLTALSCLAGCDPAFTAPVEVTVSERFQAQWDKGFPAEVGIRYESRAGLPKDRTGLRLGYFCDAASASVKLLTTLDELGCVPEDLKVTVWIAPAPGLARSRCTEQGSTVGQEGTPSKPETTPEQGVARTVTVKARSCMQGETAFLDF
ncbi:hypothetical protein [Vitiosangium sp. GDMCC 1.1324]|uniref:hypothetical protein n=1 Tax=Vitiosangium sp. (strain GDMCC 1.1324) TaxID=2138576 RepID=UPI000D340B15|nr:hypothetical protein [Vitiosangium sp. GDMCC 1.1324]PTL75195.1 hypothetical protein DAT35_56020 [Vitiosangium sp. GDMCC 1.1324]